MNSTSIVLIASWAIMTVAFVFERLAYTEADAQLQQCEADLSLVSRQLESSITLPRRGLKRHDTN